MAFVELRRGGFERGLMFGRDPNDLGNHIGMLAGHIEFFGRIPFEMIEGGRIVSGRPLAVAGLGDEMGLPRAVAHGHETRPPIEKEGVPFRAGPGKEERRHIPAVQRAVSRERRVGERRRRGKEVEGGRHVAADRTRLDRARPPGETGDAHPAFPGAPLAAAKETGRTAAQLLSQPRPVVARKNDEGILGQARVAQGVKNSAHAPVEFLDHIAVETAQALILESARSKEGHMGKVWAK